MEANRLAKPFRQDNRQKRLMDSFQSVRENAKPKVKTASRLLRAFFVGGSICLFAQLFREWLMRFGVEEQEAGSYVTITLILLTAILTAIGVFDKIGRFAGAGTYVPISGFANSIVASAIEFKSEGMVFGLGAMMFKVAGPVIVYGVVSSWIAGFIYYVSKFSRA